jgi:hypothetical protein
MKKLLLILALASAVYPMALTAYFTGEREFVTTVSGKQGVRCQYVIRQQRDQYFWRTFAGANCPSSVEVY